MESIVLQMNPGVPKNRMIQLLHACLLELEPEQKLAIELRFWEQLSITQIAFVLKVSWDYANQLLERTFLELRQMLTERLATETLTANAA